MEFLEQRPGSMTRKVKGKAPTSQARAQVPGSSGAGAPEAGEAAKGRSVSEGRVKRTAQSPMLIRMRTCHLRVVTLTPSLEMFLRYLSACKASSHAEGTDFRHGELTKNYNIL